MDPHHFSQISDISSVHAFFFFFLNFFFWFNSIRYFIFLPAMASTSAEMEPLTSGASNRIIPILKKLRKCFIFILSLVLSILLLLRPRRRVLPLPPLEEANPAPSRRWRRKMAWKLEEEDTARRRSLAEGVDMGFGIAGDGEIPCRCCSSLFYGRRGNALFSRSWLPISGELR